MTVRPRRTIAEIVASADAKFAAELAALKPIKGEPWNPSGKSPEELRARQRRNAAKYKRPAQKAGVSLRRERTMTADAFWARMRRQPSGCCVTWS